MDSFLAICVIALGVAVIVFTPFLAAWAVGVVFGFHITMTLKVWVAIWVLLSPFTSYHSRED